MKMQRKEWWFLFAVPLLVAGLIWASFTWSSRCSDDCDVSAGNFNSEAAGVKAALFLLSQQLAKCPKSSFYTSRFGVLAKGTLIDEIQIQFEPSTKILVFEPDNSAGIQLWRQVTPHGIHEVALYPNNLNGLKKYGAHRTK